METARERRAYRKKGEALLAEFPDHPEMDRVARTLAQSYQYGEFDAPAMIEEGLCRLQERAHGLADGPSKTLEAHVRAFRQQVDDYRRDLKERSERHLKEGDMTGYLWDRC